MVKFGQLEPGSKSRRIPALGNRGVWSDEEVVERFLPLDGLQCTTQEEPGTGWPPA